MIRLGIAVHHTRRRPRVVLDEGRNVESGTHKELLSRDGLYARLYRMTYEQSAPGDGNGQRPGEPAPKPLPAG